MSLLDSGCIDFRVEAELPVFAIDVIERQGKRSLDQPARELLQHIHFAWCERRKMYRPDFGRVQKIFEKLIRLATPKTIKEFTGYITTLSISTWEIKPSESYAHHTLLSELGVFDEAEWREKLLSRSVSITSVRKILQIRLSQIEDVQRWVQGGKRDHDLGWVIDALAEVFESVGGRVSYSTLVRGRKHSDVGASYVDGDFVKFCQAFIQYLPEVANTPRPTDIGGLVKRAYPNLRCVTRKQISK